MSAYASVSFSLKPAKTSADLDAIQRHNSREEALAHVIPGAPPPEHLIGTGDLRADVRAILDAVGIDPDRRRKNGCLAQEVVFGADRDFFMKGDIAERKARLRQWAKATCAFVLEFWGLRVASAVLHCDEHTPHIHVLLVPLQSTSPDKERPDWRLVIRELNGPGRWAETHTAYAAAMKDLGLTRGKVGSERKRKPYSAILDELKEREVAAQEAIDKARALQREAALGLLEQATERDRLHLWERCLEREKEALEARAQSLDSKSKAIEKAAEAASADRAAAALALKGAQADREYAARLRDLVLTAQDAAKEVMRSVAAHEREAPTPTVQAVMNDRQGLVDAMRDIRDTIESDEDLIAARDLAWNYAQRGGRE